MYSQMFHKLVGGNDEKCHAVKRKKMERKAKALRNCNSFMLIYDAVFPITQSGKTID